MTKTGVGYLVIACHCGSSSVTQPKRDSETARTPKFKGEMPCACQLYQLFCAFALTVCGCKQDGPEIDVESTIPQLEFSQPTQAPQFNPFDFGLAELDSKNDQFVVFYRPLFKATPQTRQETYTQTVIDAVTHEVTDENGKKSTKVKQVERPEVRTREIAFTVYELGADQFLRCPIGSLSVFDTSGSRLSEAQLRAALQQGRRAILQPVGSTADTYYGGFFQQDTLFIQSNEWVEVPYSDIAS